MKFFEIDNYEISFLGVLLCYNYNNEHNNNKFVVMIAH